MSNESLYEIEPNPEDFPGLECGKEVPVLENILGAAALAGLATLVMAEVAVVGIAFAANEFLQQGKRAYCLMGGEKTVRKRSDESWFPHYEIVDK